MKPIHSAILLCTLAWTGAATAQTTAARPGKWEVVKTIESSDPAANGRSVKAVRCFSAEDVGRAERLVPSQRESDERCTVRDVRIRGDEVTWSSTCRMEGVTRNGTGRMTVAPDRLEASARVEGRVGGRTVRSTHTVVGTRVGTCP